MKKLITALVAGLFFPYHAFALSSDCANLDSSSGLCAPKFCGGFYIGVTGLYLRPTVAGDAMNPLYVQFIDDDSSIFRSELRQFDPDYEWGYEAKVGYEIPCTANNIELSYFRFNNKDRVLSDLTGAPFSVGNFFFPNVFETTEGRVALTDFSQNARLHLEFDKVDLTLGRRYNDVCGNFMIRPAIGVRYACVDYKYHGNAISDIVITDSTVEDLTGTIFGEGKVNSEFKGTGPLFSLDSRYGLFNGIGLVGHFDASLLIGNLDAHSSFSIDIDEDSPLVPLLATAPDVENRFEVPSRNRIVTSLSGKLGLDYNYCFCNKSSLSVEIGYQASKYYDAIDIIHGDIANPLAFNGTVTNQRILSTTSESFDFRGPYVNVTYHI